MASETLDLVARLEECRGELARVYRLNRNLVAMLKEMTVEHQKATPHHEDLCGQCARASAAIAAAEVDP